MGKRKAATESTREGEEKKQDRSIVLYERRDKDALMHISELQLPPEVEGPIGAIAAEYATVLKKGTQKLKSRDMVVYRPREYEKGRVYGQGLQSIRGWVRRIVSYKYYHDLDIVNCAPTLLMHIAQTKLGHCPWMLREYVENRAGVFSQFRSEYSQCAPLTDSHMKKLFLVGIHGGRHTSAANLKEGGLPVDFPVVEGLARWEKSIRKLARKLKRHPDYVELATRINQDGTNQNKEDTFVSHVWQERENTVLLSLLSFFQVHTRHMPGVLVFDGLQVERVVEQGPIDDGILRATEKSVCDLYHIEHFALAEKSLVQTRKTHSVSGGRKIWSGSWMCSSGWFLAKYRTEVVSVGWEDFDNSCPEVVAHQHSDTVRSG